MRSIGKKFVGIWRFKRNLIKWRGYCPNPPEPQEGADVKRNSKAYVCCHSYEVGLS